MASNAKRVLAMAALAVAFGWVGWSCGTDGSDPFCPCDEGQVCVEIPECFGRECWECRDACDPLVQGQSACQVGQVCLPGPDDSPSEGYCGHCQQSLCPAGQECLGDACRPVECGLFVSCSNAMDLCDTFVNACYPSNGACTSVDDCPRFDGRASSAGQLVCHEGFCRLGPRPPSQAPGLEAPEAVEVLWPRSGTQFPSVAAFQLVWSGPNADAIVLVLRGLPQTRGELLERAVWGASVPASHPTELRVEDGVSIIEGMWDNQPAAGLPQDTPLYALVQLVEGEKLVAISPLVPFIIGRSWKEPGEECVPTGVFPGDECDNPRYVQACIDNRCRVLCASNRDCQPWGQTCSIAEDGLRQCR